MSLVIKGLEAKTKTYVYVKNSAQRIILGKGERSRMPEKKILSLYVINNSLPYIFPNPNKI